jgi:hypothetical protein
MASPRTDARYDRGRIEAVRTGRVAAPDCLTHMCHHVHAADQCDLHLALGHRRCVVIVPLAAEASAGFACISAAACDAGQQLAASVGS